MRKINLTLLGVVLAMTLVLTGAVVTSAQQEGTAPSNLTAELEPKGVLLRWTPGTDEDYTGQWLKVWEVNKPETLHSWHMPVDLSSVPYDGRNLEVGKTYNFQIAGAVQEDGREWVDERGYSNVATLTFAKVKSEPKPTKLSAATSDGEVTLIWTPGDDEDYVAQEVKRRPVKGRAWTTIRIDKDASVFVDEDVEVGVKYRYRVKGVWENGKGRLSKPVSVTVR